MYQNGPAFYIRTTESERVFLTAIDTSGHEYLRLDKTPAELLLQRSELNLSSLRDQVMRLWESYPLDGYDRAQKKAELSNLTREVYEIAETLRETDSLGYFYVITQLGLFKPQLEMALHSEDIDLMDVGATLLNILEEPALSLIPLRNMFEVAFDGMERATQRDRYERLVTTYSQVTPPVVNRDYPVRRIIEPNGDVPLSLSLLEYRVESLDDLHHLLFSLYFTQKKQRIVRCECCWGYFIPPTTRPSLYCDRVIEGKSCKQVGPGLRHAEELSRNSALRTYDALRSRMKSRRERYTNSAPDGRGKLIHFDFQDYTVWDENALAARKAYLAGDISAEEFLRRIDLYHDLETYDVEAPQKPVKSEWRKRVESNIRFDPYRDYSDFMILDLGLENPQWHIITSEERTQDALGDSHPLRKK